MKIRPVGAEFSHADRWTDGRMDMTKLRVTFFFSIWRRRLKSYLNYHEFMFPETQTLLMPEFQ